MIAPRSCPPSDLSSFIMYHSQSELPYFDRFTFTPERKFQSETFATGHKGGKYILRGFYMSTPLNRESVQVFLQLWAVYKTCRLSGWFQVLTHNLLKQQGEKTHQSWPSGSAVGNYKELFPCEMPIDNFTVQLQSTESTSFTLNLSI